MLALLIVCSLLLSAWGVYHFCGQASAPTPIPTPSVPKRCVAKRRVAKPSAPASKTYDRIVTINAACNMYIGPFFSAIEYNREKAKLIGLKIIDYFFQESDLPSDEFIQSFQRVAELTYAFLLEDLIAADNGAEIYISSIDLNKCKEMVKRCWTRTCAPLPKHPVPNRR